MDVMDGQKQVSKPPRSPGYSLPQGALDDVGFSFIKRCIATLNTRGLEEKGLYRTSGVQMAVCSLLTKELDTANVDKLNLDQDTEGDTKTITSAVKSYFHTLPEPLLTYNLHGRFIQAAKHDYLPLRTKKIREAVRSLPETNLKMLEILIPHLKAISEKSDENLMTVANLGVCFGPTLMWSREETRARAHIKSPAAMDTDVKWRNVVVESLIENYDQIFQETICNGSETGSPPQSPNSSTSTQALISNDHSSQSQATSDVTSALTRTPLVTSPVNNGTEPPSLNTAITEDSSSKTETKQEGTRPADVSCNSHQSSTAIEKNIFPNSPKARYKVKALFNCEAEHEMELSFKRNQIIIVKPSDEPGWLVGRLNGQLGLVPMNYVKVLEDSDLGSEIGGKCAASPQISSTSRSHQSAPVAKDVQYKEDKGKTKEDSDDPSSPPLHAK